MRVVFRICHRQFSETEKDRITPDVYHKQVRAGLVTVDALRWAQAVHRVGAVRPGGEADARRVVRAAGAQGHKTPVSPEELAGMQIEVKPVPNMYKQAAAGSSGAGPSSASPPPAVNLSPLIDRQNDLEMQLNVMNTMLEMIADKTASEQPKDARKSRVRTRICNVGRVVPLFPLSGAWSVKAAQRECEYEIYYECGSRHQYKRARDGQTLTPTAHVAW